jgi:hypothetical protein
VFFWSSNPEVPGQGEFFDYFEDVFHLLQTSNGLLYALVDCELQQIPLDTSAVVRIFDEILAKEEITVDQKIDFLERKIHHLEDFSMDIRE